MPAVYLQNCNSFGEALNTICFELVVPEYYDPTLSDYYKEPRKSDPPVINGEIVTFDEYYEKHPEAKNDTSNNFIPSPIYKAEDYNLAYTLGTISDIIDLCDNNVEFYVTKMSDLEWIVDLMDGYVKEVSPYIGFNQQLNVFLSRLRNARKIISEANEKTIRFLENSKPIDKRKPKSIVDILKTMM